MTDNCRNFASALCSVVCFSGMRMQQNKKT